MPFSRLIYILENRQILENNTLKYIGCISTKLYHKWFRHIVNYSHFLQCIMIIVMDSKVTLLEFKILSFQNT